MKMESEFIIKLVQTNNCLSDIFKARVMQSTVAYQNSLYIFGGFQPENGNHLNDLIRYDVETESWSEEMTNGTPPSPRCGHTAVVNKSSMFVFGGEGNGKLNNKLYQYQFGTKLWSQFEVYGSLPDARYGHTAVVHGDRLWIFGGLRARIPLIFRQFLYPGSTPKSERDRPSDLWSIPLTVGRTCWEKIKRKTGFYIRQNGHAPVAVFGDHMYLLVNILPNTSAYKLFVFNLQEQTWSYSKTTPVRDMTTNVAMVVFDQKLIVLNGRLRVIHYYDLNSEIWSTVTSKPDLDITPKLFPYTTTILGDATYVFGAPVNDGNDILALYKVHCKRTPPKCTLYEDYGKLLSSRSFTDVDFIVGEKEVKIPAHIAISAARSQSLQALIREAKEKDTKDLMLQVKIPQVVPEVFEIMLKYIYTDRIDPPREEITDLFLYLDLYNLALQYSLNGLQQLILEQFTNQFLDSLITSSNVLKILTMVHNFELLGIQEYCISFIVNDINYEDVIINEKFKSLNKCLLKEIDRKRKVVRKKAKTNLINIASSNSHPSTFTQDMKVFLNSIGKEFSDVTLLVLGCSIPAHKCILAARCSYFEAMFRSFNPPDKIVRFRIGEIVPSHEAVNVLLKYIYYGDTNIPIEYSVALFTASDFYGLKTNRLPELIKGNLELNCSFEQIVQMLQEAHITQQYSLKHYLLALVVKRFPDISSWCIKTHNISHQLWVEICNSSGFKESEFLHSPDSNE